MLSARISSWHLRSVHASVPDTYAQCTHQFLTRTLSARIRSWHARSVHLSVPDTHAQCTHPFLTRTHSALISSLRARSACFECPFQILNFYAYAEHMRKKLMHLLSFSAAILCQYSSAWLWNPSWVPLSILLTSLWAQILSGWFRLDLGLLILIINKSKI